MLPRLAQEALDLTDAICWATLEDGDATGFRRCVDAAEALLDFGVGAGLLAP